jgi:ribosomal protein S18 acetylase RimI-like enzyme
VLEVLFITVWERYRNHFNGSRCVSQLEEYARDRGYDASDSVHCWFAYF